MRLTPHHIGTLHCTLLCGGYPLYPTEHMPGVIDFRSGYHDTLPRPMHSIFLPLIGFGYCTVQYSSTACRRKKGGGRGTRGSPQLGNLLRIADPQWGNQPFCFRSCQIAGQKPQKAMEICSSTAVGAVVVNP